MSKKQPIQPTTDRPEFIFLSFADNKVPEFREVSSKNWILFGEDNKFPYHLLYLYNKSSNHNAIVNGKVTYVFGEGFPTPLQANPSETFNKVIEKFIQDIELFGGGRLEVLWTFGGKPEIRHIPFQNLRRSKEKNGYFYSKDWRKTFSKENEPVFIPNFDPNNKKGVQIFAYNEYRPGCEHYPLPGYFGALNDIETDVEISKYNLSVIKNGMFSSKMVVFKNGKPTDDIKRQIERDFKNKFAGSDNAGNFMLVFQQGQENTPEVIDLSTTDLDKLFDQLNKTTQAEIFSGHLVTSPMLFGIMEPGKLGGRNELQDAYEIFKNTYVKKKQNAINEVAKILVPFLGGTPEELEPVEAINLALDPVDFKDVLPKEWVLEKLEIDASKYPSALLPAVPSTPAPVNEAVKNLTGRQHEQLVRIIRQFTKKKLTKVQASTLLKASLGLSDDEINVMLSDETFRAEFAAYDYYYSEDDVVMMFAEVGEPKEIYTVAKSMKFDEIDFKFTDLSQVDSNILDQIRKDKRISPQTIAEAIGSSSSYVKERIEQLKNDGVLKQQTKKLGIDTIIETSIVQETIDYRPKSDTVEVYVKYSYEKRPSVSGPELLPTSRPFCRKLIELNKVYTRAEIEVISQRLGYSVFDRAGGWWNHGSDVSAQCRHEWRRLLVIKKGGTK